MQHNRHVRQFERVLNDCLWPSRDGLSPNPEQSVRHYAIYDVLCSLPEEGYQKLVEKVEFFFWHIPWHRVGGEVMPFPATVTGEQLGDESIIDHSVVLYLSPRLETSCYDSVVAVIAHELAHIVLGHKLFIGEGYDDQENEAWELVEKWGFGREARKHRGIMKAVDSREETWLKKKIVEREANNSQVRILRFET